MTDISGRWTGMFNYPAKFPTTPFEAELRQEGGRIVGTIIEPDKIFGTGNPTSVVDGTIEGSRVAFSKFYESGQESFDLVQYEGAVADEGREISGRWSIPGDWSGTFIMVRASEPAPPAEAETAEPVEIVRE